MWFDFTGNGFTFLKSLIYPNQTIKAAGGCWCRQGPVGGEAQQTVWWGDKGLSRVSVGDRAELERLNMDEMWKATQ